MTMMSIYSHIMLIDNYLNYMSINFQIIATRSPSIEASPLHIESKRPKFDDNQSVSSNRSWLVEKPKQKVTTYSKTRAQQWIGMGPSVNLDTLSAKKHAAKSRAVVAPKQVFVVVRKRNRLRNND